MKNNDPNSGKLKVFLSKIAIVLSLAMGLIGYGYYYNKVMDTSAIESKIFRILYSTIRQYTFSYDADFSKIAALNEELTNIAGLSSRDMVFMRITYFAFVLSVFVSGFTLYTLIKPFFVEMRIRLKANRSNSIALHGSVAVVSALKKTLDGYTVIDGDSGPESFRAKEHIIAFDSDEDALELLRCGGETMCEKYPERTTRVYLCMQSPGLGITHDSTVKVSCVSDNCARLYWEKHYLRRFGAGFPQADDSAGEKRSKVIIIGFGKYGQAILHQALSVNVFLPGTPGVEYHIFGDGTAFLNRYPEIENIASVNGSDSKVGDSIYFRNSESYASSGGIISDADRVIVACDNDLENYGIFASLCSLYTSLPPIYVRLKNDSVMETLYSGRENTKAGDTLYGVESYVFGTDAELYSRDIIINDTLLNKAKAIDGWYKKRYKGTSSWEELGTLKQLSNIAAADHLSVKLRQFIGEDTEMTAEALDKYREKLAQYKNDREYMLKFMELEHERWNRFYYLHNWKYAENRDDASRKHDSIKPFSQLSPETQNYDKDSYLALGEIKIQ